MFNPLVENVESLKDEELQKRITDLNKRYVTASRFPDQSLLLQVQQMLTMYTQEQQRRYRKQMEQQKKKETDQDLGDLINVE
jgi:hypothetical protein